MQVGHLPVTSYIPAVGVHTTLLVFTVLFLPRGTLFLDALNPSWNTNTPISQDRPQHPFLEPLTKNPLISMLGICLGTVVLQGWWAGWIREWWIHSITKFSSKDEQMLDRALSSGEMLKAFKNASVTTLCTSVGLHVVFVLFGAPFTSFVLHTFLLAFLISVLVFLPPAYTFGPPTLSGETKSFINRMLWIRLFAEFSPRNAIERAIVYPAIGAALGCWLGIIPIALDWERPWQSWPLTPAVGAIIGHIIASIYALTITAIRDLSEKHVTIQQNKKIN